MPRTTERGHKVVSFIINLSDIKVNLFSTRRPVTTNAIDWVVIRKRYW